MTWLDEQDPAKVARALDAVRESEGFARWLDTYAMGDERFALYLATADRWMTRRFMVGLSDLADWHWRDAYDGGQSPQEAVRECMSEDEIGADLLRLDGE